MCRCRYVYDMLANINDTHFSFDFGVEEDDDDENEANIGCFLLCSRWSGKRRPAQCRRVRCTSMMLIF